MVKITLPTWLDDRLGDPPLPQAALGALAATLVGYALFSLVTSEPTHTKYAKKHGLTNVKLARRLRNTHWLWGDAIELSKNASRFPDWIYEKVIESDEQPHIRCVPSMPDNVVIASPALVEDVLKTQNDIFGKGEQMKLLFHDLQGRALSMQDGEVWFHQRKVASRFFSARMYREVATKMINKHAEKLCAFLSTAADESSGGSREMVNLSKLFHEFTLQTFAELGFGLEMDIIGRKEGHPLDRALEGAFPQLLYRSTTPNWFWKLQRFLGIGSEGEYMKITGFIRTLVTEMVHKSIEHTRTSGSRQEAATIVELFVQAAQDGDSGITPDLICDVAIAVTIGGRDTSADTLNWMFYRLSKHPEVLEKLLAELWEKVPELMRGEIQELTMDQAQSLVYMDAVVRETLRLHPSVPVSGREASRDTVLIDGTFIPKGTSVSVPTYALGRLTSIWGDDALDFKPERFIDPTTGKPRVVSSFQFTSFHAGPRICMGMNLALLEMKLLVAILLSRFEFSIAPNDGRYKASFTLALVNPLMAHVRYARAAAH